MSDSSQNTQPDFSLTPEGTEFLDSPLGLKHPLLPPNPLGQSFLSPKFLSPLGAQSLTHITSLASPYSQMPESQLLSNTLQENSVLDNSLSRSSEPITVQNSLANLDSTAAEATVANPTTIQNFSETEVAVAGKEEIPTTIESVQKKSVSTEPSQTEIEPQNTAVSDLRAIQPLLEAEIPQPKPVEVTESAIASQSTPLSEPTNIAAAPINSELSISATTSPQEAVIPTLSEASPTPSSLLPTTPTPSPVVQAFAESPLTQSEQTVPTATQEAIISDEDSPPQPESVEIEPTPSPIVQTFSQPTSIPPTAVNPSPLIPTEPTLTESVVPEDKSTTEIIQTSPQHNPTQEPIISTSSENTPIQSETVETVPTQQPISQFFSQTVSLDSTSSNESPATPPAPIPAQPLSTDNLSSTALIAQSFSGDAHTQLEQADTTSPQSSLVQAVAETDSTESIETETQPSVVQAFAEDSSSDSGVVETLSAPESNTSAFAKDASTESKTTETIPTQPPAIQTFTESSPSSTEVVPTPIQEPTLPTSLENTPPQTEPTETVFTPPLISQASSQPTDSASTSDNTASVAPTEPIIQTFSQASSTAFAQADTTPLSSSPTEAFAENISTQPTVTETQLPVVQTFTEDSSTDSEVIETSSAQESSIPTFSREASTESATTETTPSQPPEFPAVLESFSTEPIASETQSTEVQAFTENSSTDSALVDTTLTQIQAFSDNASTIPTPINEPLATSNEPSSTESVLAETSPTQELGVQDFAQIHSTQTPILQTFSESSPAQIEQIDTRQTQSKQAHTSAENFPQQTIVQAVSENTPTESITVETPSTLQPNPQTSSEQSSPARGSSEETPLASIQPTLTESVSAEITPTQEPVISAFSEESPAQLEENETTSSPELEVKTFSADSPIQSSSAGITASEQPISPSLIEESSIPISLPESSSTFNQEERILTQESVVQAFSEHAPIPSSSTEVISPETPTLVDFLPDSETQSTPIESSLTSEPTIQTFSEDSRAASEPLESALIQESNLPTSSPESSSTFNQDEGIPTQESVVQAFSEDAPTLSGSTEFIPPKTPTAVDSLVDSATQSTTLESTLTSQPTIQSFTGDSQAAFDSLESTSIQESNLPTSSPESFSQDKGISTQESVVQTFSEDASTLSSLTEAAPPEQPTSVDFLPDSLINSTSRDTLLTQEGVAQGFAKSTGDESITENISSSEPTVVQPLSETEVLPQLPTVLDNLTSFQPLNSTKPLAQSSDFLTSALSSDSSGGQNSTIQRRLAEPLSNSESLVPTIAEPLLAESVAEQASFSQNSSVQTSVEPVSVTSSEVINESDASPTPSSSNEEVVAESFTDSEPTVIQAFAEAETIPQLSTALENLAPQQPLGSSNPIVQLSDFPLGISATEASREPPTYQQKKQSQPSNYSSKENASMRSLQTVQAPSVRVNHEPVILQRFTPEFDALRTSNSESELLNSLGQNETIPNSWSNISELLNGSQINYTSNKGKESNTIQKVSSTSEKSNFLDFENLVLQRIPVEDAPNSNLISTLKEDNPAKQEVQIEEISSNHNYSEQKDDRDLEILAREIYSLLRQRLEIDRERRGSYSSDRLPW